MATENVYRRLQQHLDQMFNLGQRLGYADTADVGPTAGNGFYRRWPDDLAALQDAGFEDRLLDWYAAHPTALTPEHRGNEAIGLIKSGLRDFSISRTSLEWGIPLPWDPKHVTYVWFDALLNYVSALKDPKDEFATDITWILARLDLARHGHRLAAHLGHPGAQVFVLADLRHAFGLAGAPDRA